MAVGSVRWRKTSSTDASISISVTYESAISPRPFGRRIRPRGLGRSLQSAELAGPEVGEEFLHCGEAVRPDQEQVAGSLAAFVDEARFSQHLQMTRHRLRGDVEVTGDLPHRARIAGYQSQDLPPVRLGERLQRRVRTHGRRPR